jgi:hypothetical protein
LNIVEEADVDEQASDASNTDIYLNMSDEEFNNPEMMLLTNANQEASVYTITTILLFKSYLQ